MAVEMRSPEWLRCRLVPLDGSSTGTPIGPDGHCTSAAWSPDGKWIYLTSDAGSVGFHIWRVRYPNGTAQRITSGPTEEDGIAMAPDGKSLITSVGRAQGTVWMHDEKGDRQISPKGMPSRRKSRRTELLYIFCRQAEELLAPWRATMLVRRRLT